MNKRKFSQQELVRRQKYSDLLKKDRNPFLISKFDYNYNSEKLNIDFKKFSKEELLKKNIKNIKMAGRIRTIRGSGKTMFLNIQDFKGQFQIYVRQDIIGVEEFGFVKQYDIGDIVGISGLIMKTHLGQLTIKVQTIQLLTKSLKTLPDKHLGLSDIEERYRRRYVDLIMNDESRNVFIKRSAILSSIRAFLNKRNFLEVETPILNAIHGGAAARPFKTHHNTLNQDLFLRIAPELYLKRLIVGGLERVFEIGRLFRNEGISIKHNPEFTTIEIYVAYKDMNFIMNLCEELISSLVAEIDNTKKITYNNQKLDFNLPWKRLKMVDSIKEYAKVDLSLVKTFAEAKAIALKKGLVVPKHFNNIGHIINLLFEELVESKLVQPTFIYEYPTAISPLSKQNINNPDFTDRFELFICGREYANAFSELNDPIEQYKRFLDQIKEKEKGNSESYELDLDFVEALEYGMPPTAGIGIGIDRLVMLLTNRESIKDVLLFPQLRSKSKK